MTHIIIITHGDFGAYLLEAAEMIIGRQKDGMHLLAISPRMSLENIQAALKKILDSINKDDSAIIFTDILGGTPTNVSLPAAKDLPNVYVVSGVNLNMIISACSYRVKLPAQDLLKKVLEDGKKSICDIKTLFSSMKTGTK